MVQEQPQMKITSKLFYRIEAVAFFLYWKTFFYPRLERIAWRLYRSLFRGLCAVLKPFDNSDKLVAGQQRTAGTSAEVLALDK